MKNSIHIIGGGIIGLCSAWYLQKEGFDVTIIDKSNMLDSASTGNAGMIVPSHFIPLAAPGVISQGMRWMFNPKSPFFIKPRLDLELGQWLWNFYKSCTQEHVEKSMYFLRDFNILSRNLYEAFAQNSDFNFCFEKKGLLMLFKSQKQQRDEHIHAEKAIKLGINTQILDPNGIQELEPNINIDALGAVYYPDDAHLYPNLFVKQLIEQLKKNGATILDNTEIDAINVSSSKIDSITDNKGTKHHVNKVLFSSGSWTAKLLKKAKVKMLLQDGKGYSITLKKPILKPSIPTILCESKVAVTPMGNDLRIGGTLELSNLSPKINKSRLDSIIESMPRYYKDFDVRESKKEAVWLGYRPCTPTGLPYLGKISNYNNSYIATGHGMMGMSLGPATGLIMSQIISNKTPDLDLSLLQKI